VLREGRRAVFFLLLRMASDIPRPFPAAPSSSPRLSRPFPPLILSLPSSFAPRRTASSCPHGESSRLDRAGGSSAGEEGREKGLGDVSARVEGEESRGGGRREGG